MITYRKKALKVCNIYAKNANSIYKDTWTEHVSFNLRAFIEEAEYIRIVEIFFYGEGESLVCSIIYEAKKETQ